MDLDEPLISFNPECVRKKSNWSKPSTEYKFDAKKFDPEKLLNDIHSHSPKLHALLDKIGKLDSADMERDGHLYKHFIFCDLKSSTYGAKLLAAALKAKGMTMGYSAPKKGGAGSVSGSDEESDADSMSEPKEKGKKKSKRAKTKMYGKIELTDDATLQLTKNENFYLLSSVAVFEQPISVATKKQILRKFNERPDNVYGKDIRFIIMDSGFKEGIDLFDIKYIHIFEPPVNAADQKQVIGRGTRTCGQKGLIFHPTKGWPLQVYIYDLEIPEKMRKSFLGAKTAFDLYLKALNLDVRLFRFAANLEETSIFGSTDYELNREIHEFGGASAGSDDFLVGGGPKKRIVVDRGLPPIIINQGMTSGLQVALPSGQLVPGIELKKMDFTEMRKYVRDNFEDDAWTRVKMENNCGYAGPEKMQSGGMQSGGASDVITYTPTQNFIRRFFTPQVPVKGMLLWHSVGTGKCHAKDTPIIMFDGSIKMVQDVKVGDKLMGDDSTPREVLSLASGKDEMFDIIPTKGSKYTVNSEHILCLKFSGKGSISYLPHVHKVDPYVTRHFDKHARVMKSRRFPTRESAEDYLATFTEEDKIVEIEVKDYLKLSKACRQELKGYRKGVEFPSKDIDFDPYILGLWLGDGTSRDPNISTQESKMIKYLKESLPNYGLKLVYMSKYDYRMSCDDTTRTNSFMQFMQKYDLVNNKHIPEIYKYNDRNVRLNVLAGLLDTDGYYCKKGKVFSIVQKSDVLTNDILYLVRSLGFAAYSTKSQKSCMYKGEKKTGWYNVISISGNNMDEIPTMLTRKRAEKRNQIKDVMVSGIKVLSVGQGDYYGFTIGGNNRYLLGDFTVTHNTCSAIAAATSSFEPQGYTILWVTRTTLKNDIWKNMFDQICNESIRRMIVDEGLSVPEAQAKRMKLLSKAWRIRPMSYKQFSNLVSKENNLYKTLVSINGSVDPLRKTLLIIDEAHKLYGGGDLSSIERPDMKALHASVMNSYAISGADSVRLMLMTATPITENPMELIKLMNLCKPREEQMPDEFPVFSQEYLDEEGNFTAAGRQRYLNDIAGNISYLNREKDARQFSQPHIHHVHVPLIADIQEAIAMDKRFARSAMQEEVDELKDKIAAENAKIDDNIKDLDASRFYAIRDHCDDYDGKLQKACLKVANANIRELVKEARLYTKKIREDVKEIKREVKERAALRKQTMSEISKKLKDQPEELAQFKQNAYYSLKYKCMKKVDPKTLLTMSTTPEHYSEIAQMNESINAYDDRIADLEKGVKLDINANQERVKSIKRMIREGDLTDLEKSVLKMTMKDIRKTFKVSLKATQKRTQENVKELRKTRKDLEKERRKHIVTVKKTLKMRAREQKKEAKAEEKQAKLLRKSLRKQGELREEIKDGILGELMTKFTEKAKDDFVNMREELDAKEEAKLQEKVAKVAKKAEEKAVKVAKKAEEKAVKAGEKAAEKAAKAEDKERAKNARITQKNAEKEAKKAIKDAEKAEKAREQAMRKTQKVRKTKV